MQAVLGSIIGPKQELHSLAGRVAVITGGSQGIGFNVARGFLKANARKIIIVSYDEGRGHNAIRKLKDEFGLDTQVEWRHCDLGNLKETRTVFSQLCETEKRLDLLVLSAGINAAPFGLSPEGIDRHFCVNWLGQYYALNLLYPLLRKTASLPGAPAARIIIEASELHRAAPSSTKFESLNEINNRTLGPTQLYARSKLATILGVKYGLYERVIKPNHDNVYAIAVHPGAVNTVMQRHLKEAYPGLTGELATDMNILISRSPEQGAYCTWYAATSPEVEKNGWNGVYLNDPGKLGKESSQASDPELGAKLWNLSERIVKEKVGDDALNSWDAA